MTPTPQPTTTPQRVTVVGSGLIADILDARLHDNDVTSATGAVALTASDTWRRPVAPRDTPVIGVHVEAGIAVVGPVEDPDEPGCLECVANRRRQAHPWPSVIGSLVDSRLDELGTQPSGWLTQAALDVISAIMIDELGALTAGREGRTSRAILKIRLDTLEVSRHRFIPDPWCHVCAVLPDDAARSAALDLEPQPKIAPDVHRSRSITGERGRLVDTYVDPETGVIPTLQRDKRGGLAVASAPFRVPGTYDQDESGFGCSVDYHTSEAVAVLEALERRAGMRPGRVRTVTFGSYAEMVAAVPKDAAVLDPRTVGLHPESSYRRPGFRYRPFTETESCAWTWAHSVTRDRPVLVPESLAYYRSTASVDDKAPFCYDLSNGCALGGTLVEAIAYGLLEIIERDAFLLTWHARIPAPRIDLLGGSSDDTVRLFATAVTDKTGFDVQVFDTTMEHGIPSVWAMTVAPEGHWPAIVCSAGSGFSLRDATVGALRELGPIVQGMTEVRPDDVARAHQMLNDSDLVTSMHDHVTLYSHPDARGRVDFLLNSARTRELSTTEDRTWRSYDLRDDLLAMVQLLEQHNLEVLVVNQTTSELEEAGLSAVKVIVPGTIPMTFGHWYRRADSLPRLREVPRLLGYRSAPLDDADLNLLPHPFP